MKLFFKACGEKKKKAYEHGTLVANQSTLVQEISVTELILNSNVLLTDLITF